MYGPHSICTYTQGQHTTKTGTGGHAGCRCAISSLFLFYFSLSYVLSPSPLKPQENVWSQRGERGAREDRETCIKREGKNITDGGGLHCRRRLRVSQFPLPTSPPRQPHHHGHQNWGQDPETQRASRLARVFFIAWIKEGGGEP